MSSTIRTTPAITVYLFSQGGAENDGHENDGPNCGAWKCRTWNCKTLQELVAFWSILVFFVLWCWRCSNGTV